MNEPSGATKTKRWVAMRFACGLTARGVFGHRGMRRHQRLVDPWVWVVDAWAALRIQTRASA